MSEDRNNRPSGNRLPRRSILRGKDSFDELFKNGIRIAAGRIDLRYLSKPSELSRVRTAFVAGKKTGNAVERNRCKRLMREAFRLQQHILDPMYINRSFEINMAFMVKSKHLDFQSAMTDVNALLTKLAERITPQHPHP